MGKRRARLREVERAEVVHHERVQFEHPDGRDRLGQRLEAALEPPEESQALVEHGEAESLVGAHAPVSRRSPRTCRASRRRLRAEVSSADLQAARPETGATAGVGTEQRIAEAAAPVQVIRAEAALDECEEHLEQYGLPPHLLNYEYVLQFRSCGPTRPARGWASANETRRATAPGCMTQSGFNTRT